ncbi:MAG: hypothetical protein Q4C95_05690 [Planctomycetia bacterium]|nr:hypothetical protein [Planctomycetia bacterium]
MKYYIQRPWSLVFLLFFFSILILTDFSLAQPPNGNSNRHSRQSERESFRNFEMTQERYEQLKANPQMLERLKSRGIITQERIDQWESGDFASSASPETAAAQAASAEEKAKAIAEGKEVPEEIDLKPLTDEEKAAAEKLLSQGNVPDFSTEEKRSDDSEDKFYYQTMSRRNIEILPSPPVKLRRYSRFLMNKYDANQDGRLQESEWAPLQGAQAIDTDGDFELRVDEIIYFLARFAKGKTIFNPFFQEHYAPRNIVVSEMPLKIRPLSAKVNVKTAEEAAQSALNDGFSDLSEEEFDKLLEESSEELEEINDQDLLEVLLQEMDDSSVREFAVLPQQLKGMPVWFIVRDRNGDGQLSLTEFAPTLSSNGVAFFGRLDQNGDGLLTPNEVQEYLKNAPKQ